MKITYALAAAACIAAAPLLAQQHGMGADQHGAGSAHSAMPMSSPAAMPMNGPAASTPAEYVAMAGAGDLYEKQSSQLVLQTTKDAKVREFANMMIQQHTKSTNDVKAAAMQAHVPAAAPRLNADQTRMIAELRAARGAARDAAYVNQQKMAHQQALALHQSYAANGSAAPLKMAASNIVPVVQSHIDMLQSMPAMSSMR